MFKNQIVTIFVTGSPHPLAFGPPLSKFQRRDAIWGMTPLQVPPGDRYQLQIKGEIAVITLPSPIEVEATLLTNYSSFRLLFDEPYLAKVNFAIEDLPLFPIHSYAIKSTQLVQLNRSGSTWKSIFR